MVHQRPQEAGLKVKLAKRKFLKANIKFLCHEVDDKGIHTSDDEVTAVKNFPKPQTVNNVRSFPALAGYYRLFIQNFVAKAAPLTKLLMKESTFYKGTTQENSFQELQYALTLTPICAFPDFYDPFIMCADAFTFGLREILMQCNERGKNHVIA